MKRWHVRLYRVRAVAEILVPAPDKTAALEAATRRVRERATSFRRPTRPTIVAIARELA